MSIAGLQNISWKNERCDSDWPTNLWTINLYLSVDLNVNFDQSLELKAKKFHT